MTCWKSILPLTAFVVQDITTFNLTLPTDVANIYNLPTNLAHGNNPSKVNTWTAFITGLLSFGDLYACRK